MSAAQQRQRKTYTTQAVPANDPSLDLVPADTTKQTTETPRMPIIDPRRDPCSFDKSLGESLGETDLARARPLLGTPGPVKFLKLFFATTLSAFLIKIMIPPTTNSSADNYDLYIPSELQLWVMLSNYYLVILAVYALYVIPQPAKPDTLRTWTCAVLGYSPDYTPMYQQITATEVLATVLCVFGIYLRSWAVTVLGQFFTYSVSIDTQGHVLVDSGPYAYLLHPGYSGGLLAGTSYCYYMGVRGIRWTWATVAVCVFLYIRIANEEHVLHTHFKEQWLTHTEGKWRLIPEVWKSPMFVLFPEFWSCIGWRHILK